MRNHLVSDVPVFVVFERGTDSACLAAAARKAGAQNLSAMTVGFGEAEFDETELSRRTPARSTFRIKSSLWMPSRAAGLDHAIWGLDQPSVDGLNSYWISKLAAEAGFKVALSGQGGDDCSVVTNRSPGSNASPRLLAGRAPCPPHYSAASWTNRRCLFGGANFPI